MRSALHVVGLITLGRWIGLGCSRVYKLLQDGHRQYQREREWHGD